MKHKEHLDKKKMNIVNLLSFAMGFSEAFFLYIMSSYFKMASGSSNVSPYFLAAFSIALVLFLNSHKIIRRFGLADTLNAALTLSAATMIALLFVSPGWIGIVLVTAYIIINAFSWVCLDVELENFSSDVMSGRIRGKYLAIMNMGILLGPYLSMTALERFGYYGIFITILVLNVAILFISIIGLSSAKRNCSNDLTVASIVRNFSTRRDIRRIYYISFALEFFYALMIIYTPIYLLSLGLAWRDIGIIFTIMLLPFILLQYPMGYLADKKWGEKESLIAAISLMGISTILIYFISVSEIFIWSVILFATRIGAALIEILRDSYFYKRIDGTQVDLINIFRTAKPVAYILASFFSSIILVFFPVRSIFIFVGASVLLALWPAMRLKDNSAEGA